MIGPRIRDDDVYETSAGACPGHHPWSDRVRTDAGLRADAYYFDVTNDTPRNSARRAAAIASPKFGLAFTVAPKTELYLNAGLTLNDGAVLDFQLGTASDLLRISGGTLTGSASAGGIKLNLATAGGFGANTYTLFDFTGATTNSFDLSDFTLGTTISGYTYAFNLDASSLQLVATASAIPEPGTYALMAGMLALGVTIVRRRAISRR